MRLLADQSKMVVPLMNNPTSHCEASTHCPLGYARSMEESREDGQGEAVGLHLVQIRIAPAGRHRGLREP
jgi:hypothetical protein